MMSCGIGFMEEQPERNERLPVMGVFFLPTSAPWSYEGSIASYSWPRGETHSSSTVDTSRRCITRLHHDSRHNYFLALAPPK